MRYLVIIPFCLLLSCNSDGQKRDTLNNKTIIIYDNHGKIVIIDNSNVNKLPLSADIVPPSDRIRKETIKNLRELKDKYPNKGIAILVENGSTMRDTVAATIDQFIRQFNLGSYSPGNIVMTGSTNPIEIMCSNKNAGFVKDFLAALTPLLKSKFYIYPEDDANDAIQMTIVGTPFYDKNGTITLR